MSCKSAHGEVLTIEDKAGFSWKRNEEHVLPKNNLAVVSFALTCMVFLGALDQTIVATSLPTMVAHLGGGNSSSWIGSAYMLVAGALSLLFGKLSSIFGRKQALYSSIFVFLLGSALCGAAQNMTWLMGCRALQRVGGGGLMQLSIITISDIVPSRDRGRYGTLTGAAYGIASLAGPLLGGALAQHASWKWCFFINLPIGGVAGMLLFVFLNVNPPPKRALRDQITELDFVGLFSLVAGAVFLLIGLSLGRESWSEPRTIATLIAGATLLVVGGVHEAFTTHTAILPPRLFKTRTMGILLLTGFLQTASYFPTIFYLPMYYQVLGASATDAGVQMLPYTLVSSTSCIISGFFVSKIKKNLPFVWFGSALLTVGTGLLILLDWTSGPAEQEVFPLGAAVGAGLLFQVPIVAIQATMPPEDVATATSGFMFLRVLGGAIGLAIGEAVVASVLPGKLAAISIEFGGNNTALNEDINLIHLIPDVTLRHAVQHAWAHSVAMIWVVATVFSGVALVLTLFMREYSVDRKIVYSEGVESAEESEKNAKGSKEPSDNLAV